MGPACEACLPQAAASLQNSPYHTARIRSYVQQHLRDPDLSIGTVALAMKPSADHVRRLFRCTSAATDLGATAGCLATHSDRPPSSASTRSRSLGVSTMHRTSAEAFARSWHVAAKLTFDAVPAQCGTRELGCCLSGACAVHARDESAHRMQGFSYFHQGNILWPARCSITDFSRVSRLPN